MSTYDAWLTRPPEEGELTVCRCGEEISPGNHCHDCDTYAPTAEDMKDYIADEWYHLRQDY